MGAHKNPKRQAAVPSEETIIALQLDETEDGTTDLGYPGGMRVVGVTRNNTVIGHVIVGVENGKIVVHEVWNEIPNKQNIEDEKMGEAIGPH